MAWESQGAFLYISTTTSLSTIIQVKQMTGWSGPGGAAGEINVTHLQSTSKEFIMGLMDEGSMSLDFIFDASDAGQIKMRESRAKRTKCHWALRLGRNATGSYQFDGKGYVTNHSVSGRVDDKVTASMAIRITGPVTLAAVNAT